MSDEYGHLIGIILKFDENLLLIKGWGVTFGLATIALAFKEKSRGLFLLAAISGLCFWIIEAEVKWHQSNYYYRMNQIEYSCQKDYQKEIKLNLKTVCPKIDWSWREARALSTPFIEPEGEVVKLKEVPIRFWSYIFPHVFLPHIFVVIMGFVFFRRKIFDRCIKS